MTRADLEAAAEEKYPKNIVLIGVFSEEHDDAAAERAAYIRGRLDQAEADAQIAEEVATETGEGIAERIAAEIQKGVE